MERPTPDKHKDFELLCRDFVAWEYPDYNHFTLFGKNGEHQFGCDILTQSQTLIVQCKCYDPNRKDAYSELEQRVVDDYLSARCHFKQMARFVVCTTLDVKATTQDKIASVASTVPIDIWFWEDIERVLEGIHQANWSYAQDFESPLFLHRDQPRVCLKNLFVEQKYREIKHNEILLNQEDVPTRKDSSVQDDLWNRLSCFISGKNQLLIVEGDAGCGKTSLVQALCWHELEQDQIALQVLRGRPLVTVRLRELLSDFHNNIERSDQFLLAILNYMNIGMGKRYEERKQELLRRFPGAVLVLDGFDELCILDGVKEHEKLLVGLTRERLQDWSIIVTSRPNYIRRSLAVPYEIIELQHLDKEKRIAWMKQYMDTNTCGQFIGSDLQVYIQEGKSAGVCDAPLTLYLLAAGYVEPEDRENEWRLYRKLFHDELAQRQYDSGDHPGAQDYRQSAYRLAEAVAYRMYCDGNKRLYIESDELVEIAQSLPNDGSGPPNVRTLAERCLALCCYWKSQTDRGAVEFYHNNIRDFFLSEWIWDQFLAIYHGGNKNHDDVTDRTTKIAKLVVLFRDMLRFGILNEKVISFLWNRADAEKRFDGESLTRMEREQQLCPELFQRLLTDGRIYNNINEKDLLHGLYKRLCCASQVCWAIRMPCLATGETLLWWTNVRGINHSRLFGALCSMPPLESWEPAEEIIGGNRGELLARPFAQVLEHCFAHAEFCGIRLSHADFRLANLSGINLRDAYLRGIDLVGADLRNAEMYNANLCDADMVGADLRGANLRYASLSGAILPDGFQSMDQVEQINHLRKMEIPGLKV